MLLVNIPNVAADGTGPNAGSRWPWRLPRLWPSTKAFPQGQFVNTYAPYPFFMGYGVSYLRDAGVDADMVDFMALRMFDPIQWQAELTKRWAPVMVFELATPTAAIVLAMAKWANESLAARIVLVGPHCAASANELLKLPWVTAVVKGEYDLPLLALANDSPRRLFSYEHAENIDTLPSGANWVPYRDLAYLHEYYEPTMQTPVTQLCISESRGCKFACKYCSFPKTMNNRQYRQRRVDLVLDEICSVIASAAGTAFPIRSLLTDSDTFNIGRERFRQFCAGFGEIGLPWSFMGRLDVSTMDDFDHAVKSGCVGMRFGIESFQQHVLDRTNGGRLGAKQYENAKGILSRFKNMEFHFTSMRDMPGQTESDWAKDQEIFAELRRIGEATGNRIHHQISRCMPFPGTDLHAEMVAAGHGELLEQSGYNGTDCETPLSKAVRELVPLTVGGK